MSEQTTSEGWVLRLGAAGIVGALIGMVGNLLHPAIPSGDPDIARTISESEAWIPDHLAIVLGARSGIYAPGLFRLSRTPMGWEAA